MVLVDFWLGSGICSPFGGNRLNGKSIYLTQSIIDQIEFRKRMKRVALVEDRHGYPR